MSTIEQSTSLFKKEKDISPEFNKWEMWQIILDMFGTNEARDKFINLCRSYKGAYCSQKYEDLTGGEDYFHGKNTVLEEMKLKKQRRGDLHQEIQEILQKLSIHAKPKSKEGKVLNILSDRDKMHDLIDECIQL